MKFYHGSCIVKNQHTRFTVAFEQFDEYTVQMGFATCSPKDRFERKIGRQKAMMHLASAPVEVKLPWEFKGHLLDFEAIHHDLMHTHKFFPGIPRSR